MSDQPKFRLILWSISSTGWRGTQKAVVYNAKNLGVEEHANDVGSAFWTLDNDHPQISEFVPLARHYEISRWSAPRNRWEFVGAGMLNDYNVTEYQTTFQGMDYKAVLNQTFTPLSGMTTANAGVTTTVTPSTTASTFSSNSVFALNVSTATTAVRYLNSSSIDVDGPYAYASPGKLRKLTLDQFNNLQPGTGYYINDAGGNFSGPTYYETPKIELNWDGVWKSSTTSGFPVPVPMLFLVLCSPPALKDYGTLPINPQTILTEDQDVMNGPTTIYNGARWTYQLNLFPQELKTLVEKEEGVGSFTGKDYVDGLVDYGNNETDIACLRPGVSYSFQVYAAIYRASGNGIWYRTPKGVVSGSTNTAATTFGEPANVTLGQSDEDVAATIKRSFNNAALVDPYSRVRYASLSISGSTATTIKTYSNGEPMMQFIASVCDIEMGAKTDGSKVVFGIDKPTNGGTYTGNFKLNTSVSSAATTAFALRYPESVKSFSFTPGYSRVRNDITLIPTTLYLSGSSGQNVGGTSLIGATASDSASIASNGRIPLIITRAGLVDEKAAQNEANRLLATYKPANTKQANIRVTLNGVDLWNGWDLGDSVRLTINRGLAVVNEAFVITGVRWFGEMDGHERVELDLVQGTAFAAAYANPAPPPATPEAASIYVPPQSAIPVAQGFHNEEQGVKKFS